MSESAGLLVTLTGEGLTTRIRMSEQPAADDPVHTLGLRADGLGVDELGNGSLAIAAGGDTVAETSTLVAWDVATTDAGEPVSVVALESNLEEPRCPCRADRPWY